MRSHLGRHFNVNFEVRKEKIRPLLCADWTDVYLDAGNRNLRFAAPTPLSAETFEALREIMTSQLPPVEQAAELTGPSAAKIISAPSTADANLFVTLQAFAPDGREVDSMSLSILILLLRRVGFKLST